MVPVRVYGLSIKTDATVVKVALTPYKKDPLESNAFMRVLMLFETPRTLADAFDDLSGMAASEERIFVHRGSSYADRDMIRASLAIAQERFYEMLAHALEFGILSSRCLPV